MNQRFIINSKQVRANAVEAVSKIKGEDNLEVVIRKHKKSKTNDQRAFFHVLVGLLAEETGYTAGEIKMLVKKMILGTTLVTVGNHAIEAVESSERQNRETYSWLIEGCYQIGGEIGISLPSARGFIDEM